MNEGEEKGFSRKIYIKLSAVVLMKVWNLCFLKRIELSKLKRWERWWFLLSKYFGQINSDYFENLDKNTKNTKNTPARTVIKFTVAG